jgi:ribosome-binding protein aMBF1 (putative translation factor)
MLMIALMESSAVSEVKSVAQWMAERQLGMSELVAAARIDQRVVEAIAHGRYTPSPEQRQRLATALGVDPEQIAWGHVAAVEHMYGHGPQFGRSP